MSQMREPRIRETRPGAALVTAALLAFAGGVASGAEVSYEVVDSFTLDDGRKVETVELQEYRCFQPNHQFGQIDEHDERFVNGEWGNHEFVLALPAGYSQGPVPLLLHLRGGGFAWVDTSIPASEIAPGEKGVAWGKTEGEGVHFGFPLLSTQWWTRKHAYSALTFEPFEELPSQRGNESTFISQFRKRFPEWAILYPSYCSRDAYYGRGETRRDGQRFGYVALLAALDYVEEKHGIEHLFVGGTSAGGLGAAVIARDLGKDRPDLKLLGAVVDSGPAEGRGYAAIKDEGVVQGLRRIVVDDQGTKAWIQCDDPRQDVERGLQAIGFLDFSLGRAIAEGRIEVPVFHAWQTRDVVTMCADLDYSRKHMDGAIALALAEGDPGGASVNYEKCEGTTPACAEVAPTPVEECPSESIVQVPCSKHGVLAGGPNVEDALDWMAELMERAKVVSPSG